MPKSDWTKTVHECITADQTVVPSQGFKMHHYLEQEMTGVKDLK